MLMSTKGVQVICGASDDQFIGLAGKYVRAVKRYLGPTFSIPYFSVARVNGQRVGLRHILQDGDILEFIGAYGVKGSGDEPPNVSAARALVQFDPQLRAILSSVTAKNLDVESSVCLAVALVRQHFTETYGPINGKALALLDGIATDIRELAERPNTLPAALGPDEAARYIGVDPNSLRYLTKARRLRYVQVGEQRGRVYRIADLDVFLEDNTQLTAVEMLRKHRRK